MCYTELCNKNATIALFACEQGCMSFLLVLMMEVHKAVSLEDVFPIRECSSVQCLTLPNSIKYTSSAVEQMSSRTFSFYLLTSFFPYSEIFS